MKRFGSVIIFDLQCQRHHRFEAWFKDSAAFEKQLEERQITCPVCGGSDIERLPSSVSVVTRSRSEGERKQPPQEISPRMALTMLHKFLERNFDDVGDRFTRVALRIHRGEEDRRNIRGITSKEEEETLQEEGVPFLKVPVLKFDS